MRVAHNDISLVKGFHTARTEAEKCFGNSGVYIEKFIENPHHIEFQILGDGKGNIIHLGERDCSIQRRFQKLIEEAPCSILSPHLRMKMGAAAYLQKPFSPITSSRNANGRAGSAPCCACRLCWSGGRANCARVRPSTA